MERKVYVIGGSHHNTLGVIRSLGEKGVMPIVFLAVDKPSKRSFVTYSRYIKEWGQYDNYTSIIEELQKNNQMAKRM